MSHHQDWKFLILCCVDICKNILKATWFMYYSKNRCYALRNWLSHLDKMKHISEEIQVERTTLKTEATYSSETMLSINQSTWRCISEYSNLHSHRFQNLISHETLPHSSLCGKMRNQYITHVTGSRCYLQTVHCYIQLHTTAWILITANLIHTAYTLTSRKQEC